MSRWVRLLPIDDCAVGRGRFVEAAGHELAVFRLADPERVIVIRNSCPHAGGNLAAGRIEGTCVTCPWHHWQFDLVSGACVLSEAARLTHYESRVADSHVEALLPDRPVVAADMPA
jgi:nitrite reductase (NADH) small subunit